ncbi:MAG: DUF5695 domain-containing protein, partial [Leadbetterella sp.]|nr:DUF5695 domain-containing protein [Leadbetterella sp.]
AAAASLRFGAEFHTGIRRLRENPDDFYLLRVGHAGAMGALANVTQEGFGPAAFHSYPSTLEIDGITGDYGSGFYGYAVNSGTYITVHPEFGPVAFSGNLTQSGDWLNTEITSAGKSGIYLAPEKLWITLDAGRVSALKYNRKTREVQVVLEPADVFTQTAYVRTESPEPYRADAPKDSRGELYRGPGRGEDRAEAGILRKTTGLYGFFPISTGR